MGRCLRILLFTALPFIPRIAVLILLTAIGFVGCKRKSVASSQASLDTIAMNADKVCRPPETAVVDREIQALQARQSQLVESSQQSKAIPNMPRQNAAAPGSVESAQL